MAKRKPKHRVIMFTLAFRVEEPCTLDIDAWQAQLCAALGRAKRNGEIPSAEFLVGYIPDGEA